MNISELSLKRPVLATVLNLLIILFGLVGLSFLGVREYPAIDPAIITVRTNYTGASADIIETQITEPLERAINGVPGIRTMSSNSSLGASNITVEFNLGIDLETAANDVRDKVSQSINNLPKDLDGPPIVTKSDANGDFILLISVRSKTKGLLELSDYVENVLQPKFQTINEVSSISTFGLKRYAMHIWIDPDKLNAYNIGFNDIQSILTKENNDYPSGKISGNNTELIIKTLGKLKTEDEFRDLIIKDDATGIVRLKDVAKVEIGPEIEEQFAKINCVPVVNLAVIPQPGANYINIAKEFYKRLEEIKKNNKSDIEVIPIIDNTKNVSRSINEVKETLFISLGLVVLVILFFFRNWLIAIRPLIDIPISLVFSFFIMYLMGYSINVLTLLAIVLATGLVVDDGIVVTENIFRKLESGLSIKEAALQGSKEIFFPVIATSLTLAVVFIPVIFLQGFVGSLFKEFGVVVSVAVLVSAFVSLTITPVLNVFLTPKKGSQHGKFYVKTEPFFKGMESGYKKSLTLFLKVRWLGWVILIVCATVIYLLGNTLQTELAPMEDKSTIRFTFTAPEGTNYEKMQATSDKIMDFLQDSVPERDYTFSMTPLFNSTGSNTGFGRIGLIDPSLRTKTQNDLANEISKKLNRFNDLIIFAVQEQTISVGIGSRGALPIQYVIQNIDFNKIKNIIPILLDSMRKNKTFQKVDVNLKLNKPELNVKINRLKLKSLGLTVSDVVTTLQAAFSGARTAYFVMNGKQYQVISQVARRDRNKPLDIEKINIKNNVGQLVALSTVIDLEENSNPPNLNHFNRFRSATFSASLTEGKTIGDGVKEMQAIGNHFLDESFQSSLSGASRDFAESSSNTNFALILALILIYFILSAQFESFKDPLIIMVTVPMAICGAYLCLWMFNQTINIFSQIGMIMLIGLVTKNGILIVDFANSKKLEGFNKTQSIIEGASLRLRPILMTSLATALGSLPIALNFGAAASSRKPLGIVVVGGILFSLILTLYVVPAIYTYLSSKKVKELK